MPETWIAIDEEAVLNAISGVELPLVKTLLLGSGQTNPLPGIISDVVAMVRGAIAQNPSNVLAEGSTVPQSAKLHTLALARRTLVTRVPKLAKTLLDDDRRKEIELAEKWLQSKPRVEAPATAAGDAEQISGAAIEVANQPCRDVTTGGLSGL